MRFERIMIIFIALLLIWPLSVRAQVPPSFETPPAITEKEARKFLDEYIAQYIKMDINAFMAFFSKDAVENRMLPYADIHELYRRTFDNSHSLLYHLEIYSVRSSSEGTTVMGRYEIIQTLKGSHIKKIFKGNIQWNLISENGVFKIREINYGRDH